MFDGWGYTPPPLPKILMAFECVAAAEVAAKSVKENVTVVAPKFESSVCVPQSFDVVFVFGNFTDTADLRAFFHINVAPSAKSDAKWIWP